MAVRRRWTLGQIATVAAKIGGERDEDGLGGVEPRTLAGTTNAGKVHMSRHGVGMVFLFVITIAAFGISLVLGSPLVAFASLLTGFVVAFVMATAWMRPPSYPPEHHPKIDKIFKDTAP